jgi:hypothetical protein
VGLRTDGVGQICAMVVLAQLATKYGFQIKWALEFPDAPLGAIEFILAHVIRKMGDAGVKNATFGAGATPEMTRVDNIGGFRVRTLEKAYNGISHTFNLGNKGDFRSKFGSHQEAVSALRGCHIGPRVEVLFAALHLLPEGPARHQGCSGDHGDAPDGQVGQLAQDTALR